MLGHGRRTALPRHKTLQATLDWSYDLLSASEQAVLRRLSVFRGDFTLAMACAVGADAESSEFDTVAALAELTAKSLLTIDVARQPAHYRMLFITRDYAVQKLRDSGEFDAISLRHARVYLDLLTATDEATREAEAPYWTDDIRVAIDWAFATPGNALIAVQLIRFSADLGSKLSLLEEHGRRIDKALERISELVPPQPLLELRLAIEQMYVVQHTSGDYDTIHRMADRASPIARAIFDDTGDDTGLYEILALQFGLLFGKGRNRELLDLVENADTLYREKKGSADLNVTTERMLAQANFLMGNHLVSMTHSQAIIAAPDTVIKSRTFIAGDRIDPAVTMRIFQALNHWILGQPETATALADEGLSLCDSHGVTICYSLGYSVIPIAIWRGDIAAARIGAARLRREAAHFALDYWKGWAQTFETALAVLESDDADWSEGLPFRWVTEDPVRLDLWATFHASLANPAALGRVDQGLVAWNGPEVIRAHTERLLRAGQLMPDQAEVMFMRSLDMARRHNAVAWRLRTATSLARLWGYQRRFAEAIDLLTETLSLLSEGFGDSDTITAEAVLKDMTGRARTDGGR